MSRKGFTLVQLLIAIGVMSLLAAVLVPSYRRSREAANRAQCDMRLKAVTLALDTFRQEVGTYPHDLTDLTGKGYLNGSEALHCPSDPRPGGDYADFYAVRAVRDSGDLPVITCPFHEAYGQGNQARLGKFTTQFRTRPATLTSSNNVRIYRPGKVDPLQGYAGMPLQGGDRVSVRTLGSARITFADGSRADLTSGSDMTVLQSFIEGQNAGLLYTLVKQFSGDATYTVNHGSRFDVVTPVATAGARGTKFRIKVEGTGREDTQLYVYDGTVVFTAENTSKVAPLNKWLTLLDLGGLLNWLLP